MFHRRRQDGIDVPSLRPRDRITRQHGGILSSSHAPHGADGARGVNGVNGDRSRDGLPGSPRRGSGRPGIALAIMLSAQLMIILDMTVVNIALPHIQADLHYSATSLSWVLNGYTLTSGGLLLLGGRAGDILGRRRMFIAGISLFTLASLAGGLATTSGLLLAARALQGVGGALASPAVLAVGAVHQRADRPGRGRDRPAVRRRDTAAAWPLRPGGRADRHHRRDRAGVRVHPG